MKFIIVVVPLFAFISNEALAYNIKRDQIFVYSPTKPQIGVEAGNNIVIDADRESTSVNLIISPNIEMFAISRQCTPDENWQSGNIDGYVGNISALPRGSQTTANGLKYSLEMGGGNWSHLSSSASHSFYIETARAVWDPNIASAGFHQCWGLGQAVGLSSRTPAMPVTITIDRGTAIPGYYELNIPIYWAYIEWKIHGYGTPPIDRNWPNLLTQTPNSLRYITFPVTVTSSCSITSGNVIQLNHGVMTPKSAVNNEAKTTVDLTCTNAATVNVKLLGNEVDNKSSCSSWGTCELTFDNGTNEDKLSISGTNTLSIKSTFKPKALEPIAAGKFTAHGVLQILVE